MCGVWVGLAGTWAGRCPTASGPVDGGAPCAAGRHLQACAGLVRDDAHRPLGGQPHEGDICGPRGRRGSCRARWRGSSGTSMPVQSSPAQSVQSSPVQSSLRVASVLARDTNQPWPPHACIAGRPRLCPLFESFVCAFGRNDWQHLVSRV
jgi:hypothetical protein